MTSLVHPSQGETEPRIVVAYDDFRILESARYGREPFLVQTATASDWLSLGTRPTQELAERYVAEWRAHRTERDALSRIVERPRGMASPWGLVETCTAYTSGVLQVTTAEHGGFLLDPEANLAVAEAWRNPQGSYEEDGEWSKVAFAYPALFTAFEREEAHANLRNAEPETYAALTGRTVTLGESVTLRRKAFIARHGGDLIACSAQMHDAKTVRVTAVIGGHWVGQRGEAKATRRFLIDAAEYDDRPEFGLVIDLERHREILG